MAPIYETDLADKRWSQDEWRNYELWEKVELRLKSRKRLWIGGAIALFLLISAVPIVRERLPAWRSLYAARVFAQELSRMKRVAAAEERPLRIQILDEPSLGYRIERVTDCVTGTPPLYVSAPWEGQLIHSREHSWLKVQSREFCYNPTQPADNNVSWTIGLTADAEQEYWDRSSAVKLTGSSAEISFE